MSADFRSLDPLPCLSTLVCQEVHLTWSFICRHHDMVLCSVSFETTSPGNSIFTVFFCGRLVAFYRTREALNYMCWLRHGYVVGLLRWTYRRLSLLFAVVENLCWLHLIEGLYFCCGLLYIFKYIHNLRSRVCAVDDNTIVSQFRFNHYHY